MPRLFALALLIGSASLSMGCAMCCGPYDNAYGYYGGKWQRDDLCNGRVGSVYAPAGSPVYTAKEQDESTQSEEPATLPPPAEPAPEMQPEDESTSLPLRSVQRVRPDSQSLPVNE